MGEGIYSFVAENIDGKENVYVDDELGEQDGIPSYWFTRYLMCLVDHGHAVMMVRSHKITPTAAQLKEGYDWLIEYMLDGTIDEKQVLIEYARYLTGIRNLLIRTGVI